jgi:hypothetical protein
MDHLATHPDAVIRFCASGTCLCVVSDAACLVSPDARSRRAGPFFLSDHSTAAPPQTATNGAVHALYKPFVEFLLPPPKPKQLASL